MIAYAGTCIITLTFNTLNACFLYHFSYITNTCFHSIFSTCQKARFPQYVSSINSLVFESYFSYSKPGFYIRILFSLLFQKLYLDTDFVMMTDLEESERFILVSCYFKFFISIFRIRLSIKDLEFSLLERTLQTEIEHYTQTYLNKHLYYFPTFLLYFRLLL